MASATVTKPVSSNGNGYGIENHKDLTVAVTDTGIVTAAERRGSS